jgi:hypothetical protein
LTRKEDVPRDLEQRELVTFIPASVVLTALHRQLESETESCGSSWIAKVMVQVRSACSLSRPKHEDMACKVTAPNFSHDCLS